MITSSARCIAYVDIYGPVAFVVGQSLHKAAAMSPGSSASLVLKTADGHALNLNRHGKKSAAGRELKACFLVLR
jgi:hypothetical protein